MRIYWKKIKAIHQQSINKIDQGSNLRRKVDFPKKLGQSEELFLHFGNGFTEFGKLTLQILQTLFSERCTNV